jgi:hypothetical protein
VGEQKAVLDIVVKEVGKERTKKKNAMRILKRKKKPMYSEQVKIT